MLVRFFDVIVTDPSGFLESVCRYLGVDYKASSFDDTIEGRVNSNQSQVLRGLVMNEDLLPFLAEINLPTLEKLN